MAFDEEVHVAGGSAVEGLTPLASTFSSLSSLMANTSDESPGCCDGDAMWRERLCVSGVVPRTTSLSWRIDPVDTAALASRAAASA